MPYKKSFIKKSYKKKYYKNSVIKKITDPHCSLIRIQIMLQNFKYAVPQQPHYIRTRLLMTNPWDFRPTAKRACGMIIVPW